jgi:hypothetical protein
VTAPLSESDDARVFGDMHELAAAGPAESITLCDSCHGTGVWPPPAARGQRPACITAPDVVVIFKAGRPSQPSYRRGPRRPGVLALELSLAVT